MVPSLVNPTCDTAELIPTTEARTDTGGDGARLNGGAGGGVADGGVADGGGADGGGADGGAGLGVVRSRR